MKFDQLLRIYWFRGIFLSSNLHKFETTFYNFIISNFGISFKYVTTLLKRFEISNFKDIEEFSFLDVEPNKLKSVNILFSRINAINNVLQNLIKYDLIKLYLIKSYKGRCHSLGKPVFSQRTWSNGWTSFKCNKFIRFYINEAIKKLPIKLVKLNYKKKKLLKKKKFTVKKINKKIHLWF